MDTVRGQLKLLKEKFLSDDDPKLNLLDYVSNFRHRLSSACDLARHNLQTAQSEMKLRYDKRARQRHFKPGDKVLVLLPVPQNPLQAKFFGPYTIEKMLSDLHYIVHTPRRQKQKQLCHINMLKEYFDRNSSPTSVNVVINVPSNESVEEDFESETKESNFTKLENSQILENLDQKLLHLCTTEKEQLK